MPKTEVWKVLNPWPAYEVSSLGRVRRMDTGRLLKPVGFRGYCFVVLYKDRVPSRKPIHRLVMLAFVGDSELPVNHKDGIKNNNELPNLEYVTAKENQQHASRMGLLAFGERNGTHTQPDTRCYGEKQHDAKLTAARVIEIRRRYAGGEPISSLFREFKVSRRCIRVIVQGKSWRWLSENLEAAKNIPVNTSHIAPRQAKIDWLLAHPQLWEGYPRGEHGGDQRMDAIVVAMKQAGLIAKSTYAPDVALYNLIVDARQQRRQQ